MDTYFIFIFIVCDKECFIFLSFFIYNIGCEFCECCLLDNTDILIGYDYGVHGFEFYDSVYLFLSFIFLCYFLSDIVCFV